MIVKNNQAKILLPVENDDWKAGKTYKVTWTGFKGDKVDLAIQSKLNESLQGSRGLTDGSVIFITDIENLGFYNLEIPKAAKSGTYRLYIQGKNGKFAYSKYFSITELSAAEKLKLPSVKVLTPQVPFIMNQNQTIKWQYSPELIKGLESKNYDFIFVDVHEKQGVYGGLIIEKNWSKTT